MTNSNFSTVSNNTPSLYITKNKQRVKQYGDIVYLNNGDEFQLEIFNPLTIKVLASITLNGKKMGGGIIVRPGERVYLERFLDVEKKFLFDTYEVDNTTTSVDAIKNNGVVFVQFFKEQIYNNYIYTSTSPTYRGVYGTPSWECSTNTLSLTSFSNTCTTDSIETGRIEMGSVSNQKFTYDNTNFEYSPMTSQTWKLLPNSRKPITSDDLIQYCVKCGRKRKKGELYCPKDGNKF